MEPVQGTSQKDFRRSANFFLGGLLFYRATDTQSFTQRILIAAFSLLEPNVVTWPLV